MGQFERRLEDRLRGAAKALLAVALSLTAALAAAAQCVVSSAGTLVETASYVAQASDAGKRVSFNCTGACTYTLPSPPRSSVWAVWVNNIGAYAVTISPNGLQLNKSSASVTLAPGDGEGVYVTTDNSNYYASTGGACTNASVQYVSPTGNDANSGRSWSAAKATIYGALEALPSGSVSPPAAGSGTVYVANNSFASPLKHGGIWLMGANDPNYASPPSGWLRCPQNSCAVNIVGMVNAAGGVNGHRSRAYIFAGGESDRNHPAIWFSALNMGINVSDLQFNYQGRSIVLGECSNNDRTGTCGSQGEVFENVGSVGGQAVFAGPCTDIVSNTFWIWFRDFGCSGNAYKARGGMRADNAAAMLIDGSSGSGAGLIYVQDSNFAGGGIKFRPGRNGGSLYVKNVMEEGDFSHAIPPVVWFTSWFYPMDAVIDNVQPADGGAGSAPAIQVDQNPLALSPYGPTILNSGSPSGGPGTIINPGIGAYNTFTIDPLTLRQAGFFGGYMVGLTDVGRRASPLTAVRFTNHGLPPARWSFPEGSSGVTLTQNLPDPFGGIGAAKVSQTSSSTNFMEMGIQSYTPVAGDWIVIGMWGQGLAEHNALTTNTYGHPGVAYTKSNLNDGMIAGDGQWQFIWFAGKVASGQSATFVGVGAYFSNVVTPTIYAPMLYIIPNGTISDNEVIEFANSMNSVNPNCPVGSICAGPGHPHYMLDNGGTCAMSGTTCSVHLSQVPPVTSHCVATVQGTTPIAAACNISGPTATVTAASSNSATWAVFVW